MTTMRPELPNEIVAEFRHEASNKSKIAERQGTPYVIVMTYQEDKHIVEVAATKWAAAEEMFSRPDTTEG